jgi:hypothetical protein
MRQRLNALPPALRVLILVIALGASILLLLSVLVVVVGTFDRLLGSSEKESKQATTTQETNGQGPSCGKTLGESVFIQRATSENIISNSTYLDNPLINDNPDAILFVTQVWNPGGQGGIYNNHPIGVWYDASAQKWAIFNQDREAMPVGAAFTVMTCR